MCVAENEEGEPSAFPICKSSNMCVARALSTVIRMRSIVDVVSLKFESCCAFAIFHSSIRVKGAVASVLASTLH